MSCHFPLSAYQQGIKIKTGKPSYKVLGNRYKWCRVKETFKLKKVEWQVPKGKEEVFFPCGRCLGCRLESSRQKAVRGVHELQMHDESCFITLTFDDEHLPADKSLKNEHYKNFLKRLRDKYVPKCPYDKETQRELHDQWMFENGIRYMLCGEYGELCHTCGKPRKGPDSCKCNIFIKEVGRPHYHAVLFNHDFKDKTVRRTTKDGFKAYKSEELSELWPYGYHEIGEATFESIAYIGRYVTKKITGEKAPDHYGDRNPEFYRCSLKPGIGAPWFKEYGQTDVIDNDRILMNDKTLRPPKYYDVLAERQGDDLEARKLKRKEYLTKKGKPDRIYLARKEKILQKRYKPKER